MEWPNPMDLTFGEGGDEDERLDRLMNGLRDGVRLMAQEMVQEAQDMRERRDDMLRGMTRR